MTPDAYRQLLAGRGLRVTRQRLQVLEALEAQQRGTTHAELTAALEGTGMNRATVYRNLLTLVEAGLLVRTELGDRVWRYHLATSPEASPHWHPHFVCSDCGGVSCVLEELVELRGELRDLNVTEIELRGRCALCSAQR